MSMNNPIGSNEVPPLQNSIPSPALPLQFSITLKGAYYVHALRCASKNSSFHSLAVPLSFVRKLSSDKCGAAHCISMFKIPSPALKNSNINSAYISGNDHLNLTSLSFSADSHLDNMRTDKFSSRSWTTFHSSLFLALWPTLPNCPHQLLTSFPHSLCLKYHSTPFIMWFLVSPSSPSISLMVASQFWCA